MNSTVFAAVAKRVRPARIKARFQNLYGYAGIANLNLTGLTGKQAHRVGKKLLAENRDWLKLCDNGTDCPF